VNIAKHIRIQIDKGSSGQLWTYKDFHNLPVIPVAKALSRLAKQGVLLRVRKGIYFKPKKTVLGSTAADPLLVANAVLSHKKKAHTYAGGTGAFYNARLTTQVPATAAIISDVPHRHLKIGNTDIQVVYRKLSHMKDASLNDVSLVLSLRAINKIPDTSASDAVLKILNMLGTDRDRLDRVVGFASYEPPRVKALVGAMAQQLKYKGDKLAKLKKSLNPLTKYKLQISHVLPTAPDWNIL